MPFEKELIKFIKYFFNILKRCLSSSFIISSSSSQLPATISVLIAAITHLTQTFFQNNKLSPVNSVSAWKNVLLAQN